MSIDNIHTIEYGTCTCKSIQNQHIHAVYTGTTNHDKS